MAALNEDLVFKALYETFPDPVIIIDAERIIRSANNAALRQFGYPSAEFIDRSVRLIYATDAEYAKRLQNRAARVDETAPRTSNYLYIRRDGSTFSGHLRTTPLINDQGEELALIGIIRDVSDLTEAVSERQKASEMLNAALEAMPEGFAIFDREERLVVYNRAYQAICGPAGPALKPGITAEEILLLARQGGHYPDALPGTREGNEWIASRLRDFRYPDGKPKIHRYADDRWLRVENIKAKDGNTVVARVDVTDLKRAELALERQRQELEHKNEALAQFTATVSHDLKAPLRHISMFSEMIEDDLKAGNQTELAENARHLRDSVRRMNRVVDSLLDYAQIAHRITDWTQVRLSDVVSETLTILAGDANDANATFEVGPLPELEGDPELLRRLVQNLVGNAIKYRHADRPPVIRIHGSVLHQTVELVVEDNGIGIDPRFATRIFEVFQRLHKDETVYGGTGIGLSLAKRIAESHGGSICLDTSFREGARFIVLLPRWLRKAK
ncbi:PAS domain S-box protein [Ensifer sp. ENS07]|jgi:PAS domain S-box-containing protein|uniref:histidine kinase n=1 Tax=Ensifer adhaerens TaxID=106592 RepID=A0A9Q9DB90_ENSAD|nr:MULTISPECIES: ATP-binding protein [Ensifer]MBD9591227.1 PAS domain S-box protein [Ensifer sp. ENS05]MBD9636120.1 PAS domain S-box protein [Ensifer sp. ENS07]USJ24836.1 PAS domain S-box protein [Ensifer adhaerens]SDL12161.1 PAS domain S-box-containing protein [Ensifer sp. YR511]